MIAQSAFLCSLFETVCSASKGSVFGSAVGLAAFFSACTLSGLILSSIAGLRSTSCCTVRARVSSFLCPDVDAKTRRDRSSKRDDATRPGRKTLAVWLEHGTKPGRASSRLASIFFSNAPGLAVRYRCGLVERQYSPNTAVTRVLLGCSLALCGWPQAARICVYVRWAWGLMYRLEVFCRLW